MKLETTDWKFHDESSVIERPDVFFFCFSNSPLVYMLSVFKCSPPHPNPAGFQLLPGAKKRHVPKYGHHGMWRGDPVGHGYCWMRISWVVVICCKDSKAGWFYSKAGGEFTQTTGLFSLKNILAHYMYNGRRVRLYVLVGTWTNEIPHWKPFFTNVKATVQSFPQWSMFSAVQETSSEDKKLVVFVLGTLYRLYINKSLYVIIYKDPWSLWSN